jgi:hypothetical protein
MGLQKHMPILTDGNLTAPRLNMLQHDKPNHSSFITYLSH